MRRFPLKVMLTAWILMPIVSGCSGPVLRQFEDSSKPIQRPLYSFLPPAGNGWKFLQNNPTDDGNVILFGKSTSRTHTIVFEIKERKTALRPDTPQMMLELAEILSKKEYDQKHQVHLTITNSQDNRFGPYTVRTHIRREDLGTMNQGDTPPLVLEGYIYFFFQPSEPTVLVRVMYMERGKAKEMSKNLERDAENFFQRVFLTN